MNIKIHYAALEARPRLKGLALTSRAAGGTRSMRNLALNQRTDQHLKFQFSLQYKAMRPIHHGHSDGRDTNIPGIPRPCAVELVAAYG
jgi:hypothetical protein